MTQDNSIKSNISIEDKKSPFFTKTMLHNGIENIKENIKLLILLFVLHLSAMPLILTSLIASISTIGSAEYIEVYIVIGCFGTFLGAAGGIICAMSVFNYLYKKSSVDMRFGLPMSTTQRFVSDFLSGLFVYIAPFIAAQIITWVLMLIGHIAFDGKTITDLTSPMSDGIYDTWDCNFFEIFAPTLFKGILGGLLILFMVYIFTVFIITCCGNIFECIAYNIMGNILVPLVVELVFITAGSSIIGVDTDAITLKTLSYCGPIGGVIGLAQILGNTIINSDYTDMLQSNDINQDLMILTYGKWFLIYAAITVLLCIAAFLIYKKRNAEDTGKPIVFSAFYHIIITLATIAICYMFLLFGTSNYVDVSQQIIPMIIITVIVNLLMHVIKNRGFKHIVKGFIMCAVTIGISVGSFYLITVTNGLGIQNYIPDPNSIAKAYISYNGIFEQDTIADFGTLSPSSNNVNCIADPEQLKSLTEIHRAILDSFEENNIENSYSMSRFRHYRVLYKLKSGRTIIRDYDIPYSPEIELMFAQLDTSDNFRQFRAERIKSKLDHINQIIKDENVKNYRDYVSGGVSVSPQWRYTNRNQIIDGTIIMDYSNLPDNFLDELAKCIKYDILNETDEEYYRPTGDIYVLSISYEEFTIKSSYQTTINYLHSCGFNDLPEVTDQIAKEYLNAKMIDSIVSVDFAEHYTNSDAISLVGYPPADDGYLNGMLSDTSDNSKLVYYMPTQEINNINISQNYLTDITKLLSVSKKQYITEESCYTITVDGNNAVIPTEYNEIGERMFITVSVNSMLALQSQNDYNEQMEGYVGIFIEYYGIDKILSSLEYYYGEEYAQQKCNDLLTKSNAANR